MKSYLDNLRPFEKRVVVGVLVLVFVVVNAWLVFPHFKDWGLSKVRLAAARKKLADSQAEVARLPGYKTELEKLGPGQDIMTEEQSHNFSSAIQSQAAASHVQIQNLGRLQSHTNATSDFVELSQQISVLSGEKEIVDFLFQLGSGSSQMRARDLAMRPDGPRYQLGSTIRLVASYQKKPPPKPAPPKPAAPAFKSAAPSTPTNKTANPAAKTPAPPAKAPGPPAKTATNTNKPSTTKKP